MYCLLQDDDCHWYVCPVDKIIFAYEWFDKVYDQMPNWLIPVCGSPSNVHFKNFTIKEKQ